MTQDKAIFDQLVAGQRNRRLVPHLLFGRKRHDPVRPQIESIRADLRDLFHGFWRGIWTLNPCRRRRPGVGHIADCSDFLPVEPANGPLSRRNSNSASRRRKGFRGSVGSRQVRGFGGAGLPDSTAAAVRAGFTLWSHVRIVGGDHDERASLLAVGRPDERRSERGKEPRRDRRRMGIGREKDDVPGGVLRHHGELLPTTLYKGESAGDSKKLLTISATRKTTKPITEQAVNVTSEPRFTQFGLDNVSFVPGLICSICSKKENRRRGELNGTAN
jgi:hypothetical protein